MTKISKYALKQLTEKERETYYDKLQSEQNNPLRVCGGEIWIAIDGETGEYSLVSYDLDGYTIDERYAETEEELQECVNIMEEDLADIEDGKEEDD